MAPHSAEGSDTVASVMKACRLLALFSVERPERGLADLAAETGLSKPTVHRLMSSLVSAGLVNHESGGQYTIDLRLFTIAASALQRFDIRSLARSYLEELARSYGDTAFLMVPSAGGAVVIDRVEGRQPLRVAGVTTGSVLPFYAAAGPVVMAAYDKEIENLVLGSGYRLEQHTPQTVKSKSALRRRLAQVRRDEFCASNEDHMSGVAAIAAPISDGREPGGGVVATISLGGPTHNFQGDAYEQRLVSVRAAGQALSVLVSAARV